MNENAGISCPVCDAEVKLPADTQPSEVVSCAECKSRLVVNQGGDGNMTLAEAPAIEEDWGQ